jgi:small conductance mechanosensitive channel
MIYSFEASQWFFYHGLKIILILIFGLSFYYLIKVTSQVFFKNIIKGLSDKLKPKEEEKRRLRMILHVVNRITGTILFIVVALMVIAELGLDITPLLAGAGIAGLAISFGAQTLIKDVINGLFIILEGQFSLGEIIKIGEIEGQVVDFNLRRLVIKNSEGFLYYIPNSEIKIVANKSRK